MVCGGHCIRVCAHCIMPRSTTGPAYGGHHGEKFITTRDFIQSFSNMAHNFSFLISFWDLCEKNHNISLR